MASELRVNRIVNTSGITSSITFDSPITLSQPSTLNATSLNNTSLSGIRNKIINGSFVFWERGTPASQQASWNAVAAASFIADRWFSTQTGNGVNAETVSKITDSENPNSFACRIVQSGLDLGNSRLCQIIESIHSRDLAGKTCTLSFKHACGTGIAFNVPWTVAVNYDTNDSTINSAAATSTAFETVGTNAATLQFRNTSDASTPYTRSTVTFSLPSNARRVSVVFYAFNNTQNNACIDLKEVQLEVGSTASLFENRPDDIEARLCHRYYQRHEIQQQSYGAQFSGSNFWGQPMSLFCPMRIAPTNIGYNNLSSSNWWTYAGQTAFSANSLTGLSAIATTTHWRFNHVRQAGGTTPSNGFYMIWEASFYLRLDAEL
jgi:hypothetical protein